MKKFHIKTLTKFPLEFAEIEAETETKALEIAIAKSDNMVDSCVSTVRTTILSIEEVPPS